MKVATNSLNISGFFSKNYKKKKEKSVAMPTKIRISDMFLNLWIISYLVIYIKVVSYKKWSKRYLELLLVVK